MDLSAGETDKPPRSAVPPLQVLAETLPKDRIILTVPNATRSPEALRRLGGGGFPFLVVRGVDDDPLSLLRVLARAQTRRTLAQALESSCAPSLQDRDRSLLLEACTLQSWGVGSRGRIAGILGLSGADALAHLAQRLTGLPLREVWCEGPARDPVAALLDQAGWRKESA